MKQRNYYDNVEDSFLFKKSGFPNEHSTISKKNRSEQSDHIIDPVKAIESQHADKLAADEAQKKAALEMLQNQPNQQINLNNFYFNNVQMSDTQQLGMLNQ